MSVPPKAEAIRDRARETIRLAEVRLIEQVERVLAKRSIVSAYATAEDHEDATRAYMEFEGLFDALEQALSDVIRAQKSAAYCGELFENGAGGVRACSERPRHGGRHIYSTDGDAQIEVESREAYGRRVDSLEEETDAERAYREGRYPGGGNWP